MKSENGYSTTMDYEIKIAIPDKGEGSTVNATFTWKSGPIERMLVSTRYTYVTLNHSSIRISGDEVITFQDGVETGFRGDMVWRAIELPNAREEVWLPATYINRPFGHSSLKKCRCGDCGKSFQYEVGDARIPPKPVRPIFVPMPDASWFAHFKIPVIVIAAIV